ncbi:MAG TPA: hypothetical protein VGJ26_13645 [Pirellulales bacterium]
MTNERDIRQLVDIQLLTIVDPSRREALKERLVSPQPLSLKWGYGAPDERFQCWLIGFSKDGKLRLVYCDQGFGPEYPWGIVGASQDWMGMDCDWHVGLEHAAIGAGVLDAPPDYEIP